jgi:hypothetical protein
MHGSGYLQAIVAAIVATWSMLHQTVHPWHEVVFMLQSTILHTWQEWVMDPHAYQAKGKVLK